MLVITLVPSLLLSRGIATGEKNDTSLTPSLCRRSHTVSKLCLGLALGVCTTGTERRITRWEHEHVLEEVQKRAEEARKAHTEEHGKK
jgi:hypothetical protein